MNDLDILRPSMVFAIVAQEGSFSAAAKRLNLSAPYISQMIADLELRLGCQLIYRSTRKLSLSSDGERYLETAQQIADAIDVGVRQFRKERKELAGMLAISVPTLLAAPMFARLVAKFQDLHPRLHLKVSMDDGKQDPSETGDDLAIRIGNPGNDVRPARKLFETNGIICTGHQTAQEIRDVSDLNRLRWIKTSAMSKSIQLSHTKSDKFANISCDHSLVTNNGQFIMELVRQNMGWAVFPSFAVKDAIKMGSLVQVLSDWHVPAVEVYGIYSSRTVSLSNAKSFVGFVVSHLGYTNLRPDKPDALHPSVCH